MINYNNNSLLPSTNLCFYYFYKFIAIYLLKSLDALAYYHKNKYVVVKKSYSSFFKHVFLLKHSDVRLLV